MEFVNCTLSSKFVGVVFAFIGCLLLATNVVAGTITVTNTDDSGLGSMRQAVADADPGDTIDFAVSGTITLTSGQISINKSLTIEGPGADVLTINGNDSSRIFFIGDSSDGVNISGLKLTGGDAQFGGGIENEGDLTIEDCTITGNSATSYGGGVENDGDLTIENSIISGNSTDNYGGGGIDNNEGTITITNSTITGNSADNYGGGGIDNYGGTITITNSTISDNSAYGYAGGGIDNYGGTITIAKNTISGNSAYAGGGIYNAKGGLTIENSTISGNSAGDAGGIDNYKGTTNIQNSIIANNTADTSDDNCYNLSGTINDNGYNIEDADTCGFSASTSITNTDPLLDADGLQNNGGPTKTIALADGSPAIDAIPNGSSLCNSGSDSIDTDQRGFTRPEPAGGDCDTGAYEAGNPNNPEIDLSIDKTDSPDPVIMDNILKYTLTITNNNKFDANDVEVTDTLPADVDLYLADTTQGSCSTSSGSVTCNIGNLSAKSSAEITIRVIPRNTGLLENTAEVSGDEFDPYAGNDTDTESTLVIPVPPATSADLVLKQTDSPDPVTAGNDITYTIQIKNRGPAEATGVTLNEDIPPGTDFVSANSDSGSCYNTGGRLDCRLDNILKGKSIGVTIKVKPESRGIVVNTPYVSSEESDPILINNTDSITTTVISGGDSEPPSSSGGGTGTGSGGATGTGAGVVSSSAGGCNSLMGPVSGNDALGNLFLMFLPAIVFGIKRYRRR